MDLSFVSTILALLEDLEKLIVNDSEDEPLRNTSYNDIFIMIWSKYSSCSRKSAVGAWSI